MTYVKDKFFGGDEKKAAQAEADALKEARTEFRQQVELGVQSIDPFVTQGQGLSLDKQQALSGALGPEAQAQAFQEFQESPNVAFLREQGLREIGSGVPTGGNRLRELTKFSQGLALQDLQNTFNRLGVTSAGEERVTGRQQQAATNIGGLRIGAAPTTAGLTTDIGEAVSSGITSSGAALRSGITDLAKGIAGAS